MIDLSKFTEEELIALNQEIISRIKQIRQFKDLEKSFDFKIGDIVGFTPPGKQKHIGILLRINTRSATILTPDKLKWSVSIQGITKEKNIKDALLKKLISK